MNYYRLNTWVIRLPACNARKLKWNRGHRGILGHLSHVHGIEVDARVTGLGGSGECIFEPTLVQWPAVRTVQHLKCTTLVRFAVARTPPSFLSSMSYCVWADVADGSQRDVSRGRWRG